MKLQNQRGGWIPNSSGYQETKPWRLSKPAECNRTWVTLGKQCASVPTGTAQTVHWQMIPTCVISLRLTTWRSRWNPKSWVTMTPACTKGGPRVWHGKVSLLQAHPGRQGHWELSLGLASHGHRVTFLVTKAVHARWGHLYLFYKLH